MESDIPTPIPNYGLFKTNGERKVLKNYKKSFVIRTSWVFGIANNNFNTQVINWSRTRGELNIVDDQVSAPTYSKDLAEFSWKLIQKNLKKYFCVIICIQNKLWAVSKDSPLKKR